MILLSFHRNRTAAGRFPLNKSNAKTVFIFFLSIPTILRRRFFTVCFLMPSGYDYGDNMKTILFDLDGTLGDTLPLCIAAFRKAIEPLAERTLTDGEIIATFGPSEEGTIRAFIPGQYEAGVTEYLRSYEQLHHQWPQPFPGIPELLCWLKRKDVFVGMVTGKGSLSAAITLNRYGLSDYFDTVKTGSPEGPIKERCFEEIIESFSINRNDILYVGDTPSDILASRACGIKVAAVAWASTAEPEKLASMLPDFLFMTVQEFQNHLQEWFGK
jgi:phosphoglycolate phosphatase/pyrophosphatase PpaX